MIQNKKLKATILVIAILALITSLTYLLTYEPPKNGNEYFTNEPDTWLEDRYETETTGDIEVNVYKATRTDSIIDNGKQDYEVNDGITSFFYTGFYKGNTFTTIYAGEKDLILNLTKNKSIKEQEAIVEENALMRISQKLNPNDGVIDSFIMARRENNKFTFYIFLDQDWKNKLSYTNIMWGDDIKDQNKMHLRPFDFSKEQDGIYTNKIEEDVDWNDLNPVSGGLLVGELDYNILAKITSYEDFNETFIMVR